MQLNKKSYSFIKSDDGYRDCRNVVAKTRYLQTDEAISFIVTFPERTITFKKNIMLLFDNNHSINIKLLR